VWLSAIIREVLQQTEIDGSCQTKVSVPVNTELRFPSSTMWHNYMCHDLAKMAKSISIFHFISFSFLLFSY